MNKTLTVLVLSLYSISSLADIGNCLTQAYPNISSVTNGVITFVDGATMPVGTVSDLPFTQKIQNPSVADQLSQVYPLDFKIPKQYDDAGRIRNDDLFKQLYGKSAQEVKNNLVLVNWQPSGKKNSV